MLQRKIGFLETREFLDEIPFDTSSKFKIWLLTKFNNRKRIPIYERIVPTNKYGTMLRISRWNSLYLMFLGYSIGGLKNKNEYQKSYNCSIWQQKWYLLDDVHVNRFRFIGPKLTIKGFKDAKCA